MDDCSQNGRPSNNGGSGLLAYQAAAQGEPAPIDSGSSFPAAVQQDNVSFASPVGASPPNPAYRSDMMRSQNSMPPPQDNVVGSQVRAMSMPIQGMTTTSSDIRSALGEDIAPRQAPASMPPSVNVPSEGSSVTHASFSGDNTMYQSGLPSDVPYSSHDGSRQAFTPQSAQAAASSSNVLFSPLQGSSTGGLPTSVPGPASAPVTFSVGNSTGGYSQRDEDEVDEADVLKEGETMTVASAFAKPRKPTAANAYPITTSASVTTAASSTTSTDGRHQVMSGVVEGGARVRSVPK